MWQSGDIVDLFLAGAPSVRVARLLVDGNADNGNCICFAEPRSPYHRLSVRPNGSITIGNDSGKGANFVVQRSGVEVRFRSTVKIHGQVVYLSSEGGSFCTTTDSSHPSSSFVVSSAAVMLDLVDIPTRPGRQLHRWQLRRFVEEVSHSLTYACHCCLFSIFFFFF